MPVVRSSEAVTHEMHGARFVSYATSLNGSRELCAWRGEIPGGTRAPLHTVTREEIFHLLSGELLITLDGRTERITAGDTVIVNRGATLGVENPTPDTAVSWVTTSIGLEAELADGTRVAPPWAG
ncbi:cupin domain-containing protein [Streptomyces sp. NPDC007264]|uniref:cupin domain-containing protein n=1 Tax=Streptomyces sp. NPDC007264 TaxID=3364777 RepID=UPI0036D92C5B